MSAPAQRQHITGSAATQGLTSGCFTHKNDHRDLVDYAAHEHAVKGTFDKHGCCLAVMHAGKQHTHCSVLPCHVGALHAQAGMSVLHQLLLCSNATCLDSMS